MKVEMIKVYIIIKVIAIVVVTIAISSFAPIWVEDENEICRVTLVNTILGQKECYSKELIHWEFRND